MKVSLVSHNKRVAESRKQRLKRCLKATAEDGQRLTVRTWRARDAGHGDRKSSVTDSWQPRAADNQRWWRRSTHTRRRLASWSAELAEFTGNVRLFSCRYFYTSLYSQFARLSSTNAVGEAVEWRGRTLTRETSAKQQSSSPTEAARAGTAECRRVLRDRAIVITADQYAEQVCF